MIYRSEMGWLLVVVPGVIWGASFLFIAEGLQAVAPMGVTFVRIAVGFVTLSLVPSARRPIVRADRLKTALLGILWLAFPLSMFPLAEQHVSSALAGMLNGATPLFAALVASVLARRAPSRRVAAGLAIGFAGAALIALPSLSSANAATDRVTSPLCGSKREPCNRFPTEPHNGLGAPQARPPERSGATGPRERRRGGSAGAKPPGSGQTPGILMILMALVSYAFAYSLARPLQQRNGALPVIWRALAVALALTAPLGAPALASARWTGRSVASLLALGAFGTGVALAPLNVLGLHAHEVDLDVCVILIILVNPPRRKLRDRETEM